MENSSVYRFNLILVAMAIVAMTTYIFLSNLLVSQRYALGLRWSELNRLNAGLLTEEQQGVSYNMKELLIYGQKSGLIEAKDIDSILENDGFAVLNR
ncbi:MAG: hypothetical protein HYT61_01910 [Candidatus Yanofskybacteria bacterium]|nr:hypothetical protein [Candidatus Yanofskybacteria bacterium]